MCETLDEIHEAQLANLIEKLRKQETTQENQNIIIQ